MKKSLFLFSLFIVAGILLYFLMRGSEVISSASPPTPQGSDVLILMVDSIKTTDWKNNSHYNRVKSSILLSESNSKINNTEKEKLLNSLDINYAYSLNLKYNLIKLNFTSFPTILFNEMQSFQNFSNELANGIKELNSFIQLQNLQGIVNNAIEIRYSSTSISNLKSKINNLPLGSLNTNPFCKSVKMQYINKLSVFEQEIRDLDKYIDIANKPNSDYKDYRELAYNRGVLDKYTYYRNWLSLNKNKFNSPK